MSLALALLAAALGPAPALDTDAEPPVTAVYWALPSEVEVGEPFRWIVEVRHPAGRLRGLEEQLSLFATGLDESWVLLADDAVLTTPDPELPGWSRTRAGWTAVSLEPGERELPALELVVGAERIPVRGATLEVAGLLGESEDEHRPARGLRAAPEGSAGRDLLLPGLVAAAVLAGFVALLLRRRRAGAAVAQPDARAELEALLRGAQTAPPEGKAAVDFAYAVSARVRDVFDERAGTTRRGLTDEEWVASSRVAGEPAVDALEAWLQRCTRIEVGAADPSPWAVRELIEEAQTLVADAAPEAAR